MKLVFQIEVTTAVLDMDLYFWLNDDVQNRTFRNCSNNKDFFEVSMGADDALNIDVIVYAMTGTDYIIKYAAKREDGEDIAIKEPESPIENTVKQGNRSHELITIKL